MQLRAMASCWPRSLARCRMRHQPSYRRLWTPDSRNSPRPPRNTLYVPDAIVLAHTPTDVEARHLLKLGLQAHRDRLMVMRLADVPVGIADRVVNRMPALPLVHRFQSCEVSVIASAC